MGKNTKIGWTHHSNNLWWGCTEVHEGCDFCYARGWDAMRGGGVSHWGNDAPRLAIKGVWTMFKDLQQAAAVAETQYRVFVGSMMDIFEKSMPLVDWKGNPTGETTGERRERYLREVVPATPNLTHLCLTKRPTNICKMLPDSWLTDGPPPNIKFGYSAVNQDTAKLIDPLLKVPGGHFLSCEPLLGPLDLREYLDNLWYEGPLIQPRAGTIGGQAYHSARVRPAVEWVIIGGESGSRARPLNLDWVLDLIEQCKTANVPVFVKQLGELWAKQNKAQDRHGADPSEWPEAFRVQEVPAGW